MKGTFQKRILSLLLCAVMIISVLPMTVFAEELSEGTEQPAAIAGQQDSEGQEDLEPAEEEEGDLEEKDENLPDSETSEEVEGSRQPDVPEEEDSMALLNAGTAFVSETHDVFKHTESTLAPGVEQYINYAYAKDGKQMVYYVATADITRDDVVVQTSYLKQHENGVMGMDKLTNQIAYANQKYTNPNDEHFISEYYNVVAGVNASFYNMTTGQPTGITFIDGVSFGTSNYDNFFAILKDGKTAVIDYATNLGKYVDENGESTIWQAAAGSQWLVRDGKDVTAGTSGAYNTERHSRTCVGVTAEGKVVLMVLDGRQEPFSCGGTMHELAQIMLEAGCVAAVNLDGGGSTTYAARPEGSDKVEVINRPSDGSERSISSGLIVASTAVPSNTFDRVTMNAEDEYVTAGTSTKVTVAGVSPSGSSAEIPTDIAYTVVNGTYENGVLTATAVGDVVLTATYNGKEVGSVTIHAVVPEKLAFNSSEMTVPFGKTVTLALTATYGLNEVKIKASDIQFTLENDGIGTIDGFDFAAGDGSVTESSITATIAGTAVSATSTIKLGKGSEVIYDFEDKNVSDFDLGYGAYNYVLPEGKVYPVTAATGKVHSGNGAMALDINYGNSLESGYMMTALTYLGKDQKFENATKLGMWIYISDEDVSTWIRYTVFPLVLNDNGEYVTASSTITNTLADGVASTTGFVNQYQEPGWHYLSIDLSAYKGLDLLGNYYILQFYISDRDGAGYDYWYNQHKSYNGRYVMYVDDITVDYSDAVDDREAPVFGDVTYATGSMSDATALNGQTVSENVLSFGVKVADNTKKNNFTGLNIATAKAYIDGVETACTYKDGVMSLSDVTLADGMHHVKFSICDNQGNYASVIRTINVQANSGKSTIKVVARDPSLDKILLGSVWYADIVATDIEKVQSVTVDIDLNNMSKWELDHMTVAAGFEASYSIQGDENIATITITRTGENTQTGEAALASLPIRTWELRMGYTYESGTKKGQSAYTYAQFKSMKEFWPIDISMEIDRGIVTLIDGTTDTFSGEGPQVDTEMYKMAKDMISTSEGEAYYNSWNGGHIHTAKAIADKAATCTEAGYTGRTYCEVCKSVVDWGTTVPATGHSYEVVDGVLKCTGCGELFTGTWTDGKEYVDGVIIQNGWKGDSYYIDGIKQTGLFRIGDLYYDFGEDGVCAGKGAYDGFYFDKAENAYRHFTAGRLDAGDVAIYPTVYFFDENGLAISGEVDVFGYACIFDEKGAFISCDNAAVIDAGYCGTNIKYVLLSDGTLMVDGEGAMKDYTANGIHPAWIIKNDMQAVTSLVIGAGITSIGRYGFYRNGYLKKVTFESGSALKHLSKAAFGHCWRLESVTLPASVEALEENAFYECGALKSFNVENGSKLRAIGACAFMNGHALKTVYIPDSVTELGGDVFYKANSDLVVQVVRDSAAHVYAKQHNLKVELRDGEIYPLHNGTCSENVDWALYPDGTLKVTGSGAMGNYTSYTQQPWVQYRHQIKSIVIGKDITTIGNYAFAYSQNVESVTFEEGSVLTSIGALGFINLPKLTDIELPETVTSISAYALGDCFALESVYVPQGVSFIYFSAFSGSDKVTLSVAKGSYAEDFAKAKGIKYTTRAFETAVIASGNCGDTVNWELYTDGVLKVTGSGAMGNYTSYTQQPWVQYRHQIKSIVIGKDITTIGNYAFAYSQNVESVTFEEGSVLTSIGALGFINLPKLTDIELPETVTSISAYALGDCFALESVYVPQGVSFIYFSAFSGSDKVTLSVAKGSYAERFAQSHSLSYTSR